LVKEGQMTSTWKALVQHIGVEIQQYSFKTGITEIADQMMHMGRRDYRTWRGKIFRGSFGKVRPKKQDSEGGWWNSPAQAAGVPIPFPPEHKSAFPPRSPDQPRQLGEPQPPSGEPQLAIS